MNVRLSHDIFVYGMQQLPVGTSRRLPNEPFLSFSQRASALESVANLAKEIERTWRCTNVMMADGVDVSNSPKMRMLTEALKEVEHLIA